MKRAALLLLLPFAARAEIKERVAAVVNGQPIALSDVEERVAPELTRLKGRGMVGPVLDQQRKDLLKRGLDQLVDEKLVEGEAGVLGIDVPEDEVQKLVSELAKQNGMDSAQFREALTGQGIDFETVRDSLKRQQLMLRLLQYKVKPRKVSDEEVHSAYAAMANEGEPEVRARHLFIAAPDGAPAPVLERAKLKADEAVRRLQQGESFAKVARDLSEGPGASEGGDLGYFRRGQMLQAIDQAAFRLKPGETSELIRTGGEHGGYHLVHVEDRRKLAAKPLAEVQEEIRNKLANESILKEREHYLTSLRKAAQIDLKM
jgi:peptidyl-prolyl cis-trans isomerase SurA